jgi:type II restriction enzyme
MKLTPQQVFDLLVHEDKILEINGQIKFFLGDVDIVIKQKDVVGNIMQEWVQGWLVKNGIEFSVNPNTQMPPDFYLDTQNKQICLLEVKAFNRSASPAFDIADFRMYAHEIVEKPYMLDVDYLIFGYDMADDGTVAIKGVWLKKVWQITRRMKNWPINLQVKEGMVHKIRPATWYTKSPKDFKVFDSIEDFISAIEETVYQNQDTHSKAGQWKNDFVESYARHYGVNLDIPRWYDIAEKYVIDKERKP